MSDAFQLRIVTPTRQLLDESVNEVTAPGTVGEFGVLPQHTTFLSSLEIGPLSFRSGRTTRRIAVRGGFAEVADDVMTVLADAAQFAEEIDSAKAQADLRDAEARMKDYSPLDDDYLLADADRRWAELRLTLAGAKL
ncbi:MAG TPA: F0F1 ATP synthase subunit epsilon [Candidatus Kryptonia bacterium]|nr:F0F1 ATP synthase subunit epsilon [Candidatus Kryptonia bacterium]